MVGRGSMEPELTITSTAAAAAFSVVRQRKILMAASDKERSLSELSSATGTALNLLHHHVQRLLDLGLLAVVRTEPRAGRPIRYYRSVAHSFFVPAELMKAVPADALHLQMRALLERSLARSIQGYCFTCEAGRPRMRVVKRDAKSGPAAEIWFELRLSRADAVALDNELRGVIKKYEALSAPQHSTYIVHTALAPT